MVSNELVSALQLFAIFHDPLVFAAPGRLIGGFFSMGSQHKADASSCRSLTSNMLSCKCFRCCPGAEEAIVWPRPGCENEPLPSRPSGCLIRQTVNNRRWSTGSHMIAKKGMRGMAIIVRTQMVAVQRTVTNFISTYPKTFPSPMTRSRCFEPSFPTKSARSCVVRIRMGDEG